VFNNLFTTLPNPDNNTFDIINKAVNEYLWKGCARIKSTVITKPYLEGGINMIAFIISLKVCLIRRCLNSNSNYINLCSQYFDIIKLVTVGKQYADKISSTINNKVWGDVMMSYSQYLENYPLTGTEDLNSQPLFYNHRFLIGKQSVFYKSWYDVGIQNVCDIINENGNFLSKQKVSEKFQININFLHFLGLTNSIKKFISNTQIFPSKDYKYMTMKPFISKAFQNLIKLKKSTKGIYNVLNQNDSKPTSQEHWVKLQTTVETNIFFVV